MPVERDELLRVLRAFQSEGLEYFLIGATAMGFHGLIRATEDVDLLMKATLSTTPAFWRGSAGFSGETCEGGRGEETGVANSNWREVYRHSSQPRGVRARMRAHLSYARTGDPLHFWRSKHGYEVDYLIGDRVAIEIKATRKASLRDARGLMALKEERVAKCYILVSEDPLAGRRDGIEFLPWTMFLTRLWEGDIA